MVQQIRLCEFQFVRFLNGAQKIIILLKHKSFNNQLAILKIVTKHQLLKSTKYWLPEIDENIYLDVFSKNNVYHEIKWCLLDSNKVIDGIFIYPASEAHVKFYTFKPVFEFETAEDYHFNVAPFFYQLSPSYKWIRNILKGKAEKDKVIYRDDRYPIGFVLTQNNFSTVLNGPVKFCAFSKIHIPSLRNLRAKHIPLLKNILYKSTGIIERKFNGLKTDANVHYHPAYWHFHVHFTTTHMPKNCHGTYELKYIIEKLKEDSDYFKNATLSIRRRMPLPSDIHQKEFSNTKMIDLKLVADENSQSMNIEQAPNNVVLIKNIEQVPDDVMSVKTEVTASNNGLFKSSRGPRCRGRRKKDKNLSESNESSSTPQSNVIDQTDKTASNNSLPKRKRGPRRRGRRKKDKNLSDSNESSSNSQSHTIPEHPNFIDLIRHAAIWYAKNLL